MRFNYFFACCNNKFACSRMVYIMQTYPANYFFIKGFKTKKALKHNASEPGARNAHPWI